MSLHDNCPHKAAIHNQWLLIITIIIFKNRIKISLLKKCCICASFSSYTDPLNISTVVNFLLYQRQYIAENTVPINAVKMEVPTTSIPLLYLVVVRDDFNTCLFRTAQSLYIKKKRHPSNRLKERVANELVNSRITML